jgi:hypothetical protein
MKYRKKIVNSLIVLFLAAFVFNIMWHMNKMIIISKNNRVAFPHITKQYLEIFNKNIADQLEPSYTYYNKYKQPIASYNLNNGDYQIMVYNLDYLKNNGKLKDCIFLDWETNIDKTPDLMYDGTYSTSDVHFNNAEHWPERSKKLYLSLDARQIKEAEITDSLICYSAICTAFAGKTSENGMVEFYLERNTIFKNGQLSFAFARKQDRIFMFILTPRNLKGEFDNNLLYTILSSH